MPARGPVLRDKYVLRLIAFDRFTHVVVLVTLAVLLFAFGRHHAALQQDYNHIMDDLSGAGPGTVQARGVLVHLKSIFNYSPKRLYEIGLVVTAYAALEATEMVGPVVRQAVGRVPDARSPPWCSSLSRCTS